MDACAASPESIAAGALPTPSDRYDIAAGFALFLTARAARGLPSESWLL
jgi:hypothetical protein